MNRTSLALANPTHEIERTEDAQQLHNHGVGGDPGVEIRFRIGFGRLRNRPPDQALAREGLCGLVRWSAPGGMKPFPTVPMLVVPASVRTNVMCPFPAAATLKISFPSSVISLDLLRPNSSRDLRDEIGFESIVAARALENRRLARGRRGPSAPDRTALTGRISTVGRACR